MVQDDEFSNTLSSMTIKEERLAINNVPTFKTKSMSRDIKKEFMKTKEFNKTLKSNQQNLNYIDEDYINENIDENPEDNSYNTLDDSTGQEYYNYLEFTVS
jgi:hypothetical protein